MAITLPVASLYVLGNTNPICRFCTELAVEGLSYANTEFFGVINFVKLMITHLIFLNTSCAKVYINVVKNLKNTVQNFIFSIK
jgi:hypothetical protein